MGKVSDTSWRDIRPSGRSIHDEPHDNEYDRAALVYDLCQLGLLPKGLATKRYTEAHDHLLSHFAGDVSSGEVASRAYVAERRARRALAENRLGISKARIDINTYSHKVIEDLVQIGKMNARRNAVGEIARLSERCQIPPSISPQTIQQNRTLARAIAQGRFVDGLEIALAESLVRDDVDELAKVENFLNALAREAPKKAEELHGAIVGVLAERYSNRISDKRRSFLAARTDPLSERAECSVRRPCARE